MDSGLLTVMEGYTGHFGVRRQLYLGPYRNPWCPR